MPKTRKPKTAHHPAPPSAALHALPRAEHEERKEKMETKEHEKPAHPLPPAHTITPHRPVEHGAPHPESHPAHVERRLPKVEVRAGELPPGVVERIEERLKSEKGIVPTVITRMFYALELSGVPLAIEALARVAKTTPEQAETIARVMEEQEVCEIKYPLNIFTHPAVQLKHVLPAPAPSGVAGDALLVSYLLNASGVPARVEVWNVQREARPIYDIQIARVCPYTEVFLEYLREKLSREVPVLTEEITDPKKLAGLRDRFHAAGRAAIVDALPALPANELVVLSGVLLHKMYGLGDLELLMSDDNLEEIAVNTATEPVSVYHKKFGWLKTSLRFNSEEEIYNTAAQIGRKAGRDITLTNPIMDAPLLTGDRVTATLFPISSSGNTLSIRRFAREPWTVIDFIAPTLNTMSVDIAALLWLGMQYEMNILVSGGTASGKTSALNTLAAFIPPSQRIITVEETRELQLPGYLQWNWVPLVTRSPNPEGRGGVDMLDLIVASLRMRPDRILVGEVRRRNEAEVLFEAMHTGHSVYSTLHADSAQQVLRRLTQPPIEIPETELESLHLIVTQFRDRRRGIRRTFEVAEILPGIGGEMQVALNTLFKWKPRTDTFEKVAESNRMYSELNLHTGLTLNEINEELAHKKAILQWMLLNNLSNIENVGDTMKAYYKDPAAILKAAERNEKPDRVI